MIGLLKTIARDQWAALEIARQQVHVASGESGEIVFESLDPSNAPDDLFTVKHAWEYTERTHEANRIPADALFELRISELELSASDFAGYSSIRHDDKRFQAISPSPLAPSGTDRFWRFWLVFAEDAE
jgi:hypothetical protein